jgi:WXG100 family type VII secretion target
MSLIGMDPELVDQLGNNLKGQADAIQGVINAVNGLVMHSQDIWKGQDAMQFLHWWETQHRPALQHVMEAVNGLAQSAHNNANEQRSTSGH